MGERPPSLKSKCRRPLIQWASLDTTGIRIIANEGFQRAESFKASNRPGDQPLSEGTGRDQKEFNLPRSEAYICHNFNKYRGWHLYCFQNVGAYRFENNVNIRESAEWGEGTGNGIVGESLTNFWQLHCTFPGTWMQLLIICWHWVLNALQDLRGLFSLK